MTKIRSSERNEIEYDHIIDHAYKSQLGKQL